MSKKIGKYGSEKTDVFIGKIFLSTSFPFTSQCPQYPTGTLTEYIPFSAVTVYLPSFYIKL